MTKLRYALQVILATVIGIMCSWFNEKQQRTLFWLTKNEIEMTSSSVTSSDSSALADSTTELTRAKSMSIVMEEKPESV